MADMVNEGTGASGNGKDRSEQIALLLSGKLEANGNEVDTEILLDAYLLLDEHPETPDHASYDISEELEHRGMPGADAIKSRLDFSNPENYVRTGKLIELLHTYYGEVLVDDLFGNRTEGGEREIHDTLENALREKQGSYLLKLRAQELIREINSTEVFDISPDEHGVMTEKEIVEALPKASKSDIHDFMFLNQERMNKIVEQEFGFKISDLPIHEQFWFLQFIKHKETNEIEPVKDFVERYGLSGLRTFLALDYGRELGDGIVEIGLENPDRLAGEVFDKYSQLIDASEGLRNKLGRSTNTEFAGYVQEAFLRRAKDLLLASRENVHGVIDAMDGLHLFLEIIDDLKNEKNFTWQELASPDPYVKRFKISDEVGTEYLLRIGTRAEKNSSGQARINFELDFDTNFPNIQLKQAFSQVSEYPEARQERKKIKNESVLRLGLDLDERGGKPELSLDFGRSKFEGEKIKRTGDTLGNLLMLSGTHHTPESFPIELSNPEKFKYVVLAFQEYLNDSTYTQIAA